jgi:phenylalanyl-tRNA synthetase beta chain
VYRDISAFVPDGQTFGDLVKVLRQYGGEHLASISDPQEYLKEGRRSITVHLEFSHPERTMTDQEVNRLMAEISGELSRTGYTLRD